MADKNIVAPTPTTRIDPDPIILGPESIDNILKAVGEQFIPLNLDRLVLASELQSSAAEYRRSVKRAAIAPDRKRRLQKISKAAKRIRTLLDDDVCVWIADHRRAEHLFLDDAPHGPCEEIVRKAPDDEDVRKTMERLIQDVESFLEFVIRGDGVRPPDLFRTIDGDIKSYSRSDRSRFEHFAGLILPNLYKSHFAAEPTFTWRSSDGEAEGPFVRFAHRVLIELGFRHNGQEYTKSSIVTALSDARRDVVRRSRNR
jgi:hypothetical protein